MASHGAGVAAGSGATPAEASISGQTNSSPYPPLASGQHSWSSSTGVSTVPWSYPVNNRSQDTVYYDPQRDVSVLGDNQNVASTAAHNAQPTMGIENATHSHVPYSSSLQPGYTAAEYANCYNYPQTTNDSSILQGGANQHSGAAHQPLTSFQNSESYVGPTSNTYYNAGGHQTVPGYGTSNYHYQNNTWNGGSFENNYLQSYQNYPTSNTNAVQHSISTPTNSFSYQQQYNQWPRYYNHTVPNPAGDPVGNSNTVVNTTSSYSYPSIQPPPPGTTSWKSNSSSSVAPPIQASVAPEPQNQYINQTHIPLVESRYADQVAGNPRSYNHYAGQTPVYPQSTVNLNPIQPSNHGDQQNTVGSKGPNTNIYLVNHVSEKFEPKLQVFMTTETSSQNKMQVPRIAPGFSMVIPKSEKKSLGADLAKKPAYVSVSMVKNDTRQLPFSLNNYATRNLNCCKDEAQRAACQSMIEEIKNKAIADGTLLTKNWDTEPLLPLLENVATIPKTSANNSSPSLSTSTNRRRLKSRWEPVVEEKVTDKSNNWDSRKFFQSHQATANKVSQQPAKKQKISSYSGSMQNGNASSDSDKEQDLTKYYTSATTLANSPEEKKRREHRSKRFEKNQNSPSKSRNYAARKDVMANVHARRAVSALLSRSCEDGSTLAVEDMDWDALTVKGTCQEIEKQYLRLTSAPDPATVRPEHVLEKALSLVKTSQKNYLYKCDQLKSIRQDLTVQRIQNELTIKVYETHARLAMQAGDLPEYNQCQSQLKRLYAEGIKGCYFEFSAYNLLCVMLHSNKRDLLSSLASLSKEAKKDEAVKHALAVHSAVSSGNYVLFFKLYKQAPNLNSCLMDLYVERMRLEAVKCMSKSYRPTIPVGYVAQILGFLRIDSEASEECEVWLKAHGAILSTINGGDLQFDTKASATTLYMPEPENAVSHGDASLAVNDFLARTEKKQFIS
uniref:PCI domain-containing protein n=1 Tax=Leersia perrieri TaxID=77586 RepID=A0A0D9WHE4_9ORYZ